MDRGISLGGFTRRDKNGSRRANDAPANRQKVSWGLAIDVQPVPACQKARRRSWRPRHVQHRPKPKARVHTLVDDQSLGSTPSVQSHVVPPDVLHQLTMSALLLVIPRSEHKQTFCTGASPKPIPPQECSVHPPIFLQLSVSRHPLLRPTRETLKELTPRPYPYLPLLPGSIASPPPPAPPSTLERPLRPRETALPPLPASSLLEPFRPHTFS